MYEQVDELIKREGILDPSQTVLVGVSGGPDSLVMMDILDRLGYHLIVAHLNHRLRPEAEAEAREVKRLAEARGFSFTMEERDVRKYADENGLSIEEAARIVRYQFLFQVALEYKAQAVAVGHTADDQVETVIMHILRGSGLAGLKGMLMRALPNNWSHKIALVRPLLTIWREDVLIYCEKHNLRPVLDSSNLDLTYFRNRLRHELIPYLEGYNPAVKQVLWRMSQVLAGDHQVLEQGIDRAWNECITKQASSFVIFDSKILKKQPIGVQRGLVLRAINVLRPGLRDVDFKSLERATTFLIEPTQTGQIDLISGLRLFFENGLLVMADWDDDLPRQAWPQINSNKPINLEIPGRIELSDSWLIKTDMVIDLETTLQQAKTNEDPFQAWISLDNVDKPLKVRARKPGDRFQPLGMEGHSVKLSEYMINVKVPRRVRDNWPIIVNHDEIVWVPGIGLSHLYRLTETTQRAAYLQVFQQVG